MSAEIDNHASRSKTPLSQNIVPDEPDDMVVGPTLSGRVPPVFHDHRLNQYTIRRLSRKTEDGGDGLIGHLLPRRLGSVLELSDVLVLAMPRYRVVSQEPRVLRLTPFVGSASNQTHLNPACSRDTPLCFDRKLYYCQIMGIEEYTVYNPPLWPKMTATTRSVWHQSDGAKT